MRRTLSLPVVATILAVAGTSLELQAQSAPILLGTPTSVSFASDAPPAAAPAAREPVSILGRSGALRVVLVRPFDPVDLPSLTSGEQAKNARYRWVPLFGTGMRVLGEAAPGAAAGPRVLGEPALGAVAGPQVLGEPAPGAAVGPRLLGEPARTTEVRAPAAPGMWKLEVGESGYASAPHSVTFITQVPITEKRSGELNGYRIGHYPTEGSGRTDRYAPPAGFIEVTPENQDLHVSEHFRLRQFLTKDQFNVWPKYVALDLRLIDKLELVLQELNAMGVRAQRMHVMSGFRTPQYNGPGGDGRATLSRHMYGDASDVWVDNDGDGYIDDLNGDGSRDLGDAEMIIRAVDRVERKYPELVGGAGLYQANSAHGPFVHIDVRGAYARW